MKLLVLIGLVLSFSQIAVAQGCEEVRLQCSALVQLQKERISSLEKQLEKKTKRQGDLENLLIKYDAELEKNALLTLEYKAVLGDAQSLNDKYKDEANKLVSLNGRYNVLAEDFDKLAGKYRRLAVVNTNVISLDLGIGLTGYDVDDAVGLVGVGFKNIKLWGLLQKDKNGAIFGTSIGF